MGVTKNYNKTILQTSFTSLESIYYLLQVVKQNQPMTSADGKNTIFPVARARIAQARGGEWSEENRDTHAELTLKEMRFIRYTDEAETIFEVSDSGNEFLNAFRLVETPTDTGKVTLSLIDNLSLDQKNQMLLDILIRITVVNSTYGRNIRPYLVLFKLLTEPELEGYISKAEWACFINSSEYLVDTQYPQIRDRIIEFRKNDEECEPKKSDRILTRLVLWKVLDRVNIPYEPQACFCLNEDFSRVVEVNMLQGRISVSTSIDHEEETETIDYDAQDRLDGGVNILLYGVPGSGKSWTMEHEYCKPGTNVERLVFHPDYTNADFVGQILPVVDPVDKQVTYEFTPGPFTNILREAYAHPQKRYILVIEEINRGNAPAIFGDVFQLLDRTVEPKTYGGNTYPVGTSEYGITNSNVAKVVYGDETHKVRIPSNLSILGTMNTSDQNVFTLDTAFQRRWRMRLIENNFFNVRTSLAQAEILDTGVTWRRFCETVNEIIIGNKAKMASAEDKRLGVYFVHENDLRFDDRVVPKPPHTNFASEYNELLKAEIMNGTPEDAARLAEVREALMQIRIFPEKVIKYLWDDAFKFNPEALFDTDNMDSLEKVIRTFVFSQGPDRFKIFRSSVQQKLYPSQQ